MISKESAGIVRVSPQNVLKLELVEVIAGKSLPTFNVAVAVVAQRSSVIFHYGLYLLTYRRVGSSASSRLSFTMSAPERVSPPTEQEGAPAIPDQQKNQALELTQEELQAFDDFAPGFPLPLPFFDEEDAAPEVESPAPQSADREKQEQDVVNASNQEGEQEENSQYTAPTQHAGTVGQLPRQPGISQLPHRADVGAVATTAPIRYQLAPDPRLLAPSTLASHANQQQQLLAQGVPRPREHDRAIPVPGSRILPANPRTRRDLYQALYPTIAMLIQLRIRNGDSGTETISLNRRYIHAWELLEQEIRALQTELDAGDMMARREVPRRGVVDKGDADVGWVDFLGQVFECPLLSFI